MNALFGCAVVVCAAVLLGVIAAGLSAMLADQERYDW